MKTITKNVNPTFKFWIENKIANEGTFFVSDIRQQFEKWLKKKETDWIEYYGYEQVISYFIGDKDGLNSVGELDRFQELVGFLKPEYKKRLGR